MFGDVWVLVKDAVVPTTDMAYVRNLLFSERETVSSRSLSPNPSHGRSGRCPENPPREAVTPPFPWIPYFVTAKGKKFEKIFIFAISN